MKKALLAGLLLLVLVVPAGAGETDGVISVRSTHGVKVTADRLESILRKKGMTVFNRINHASAAEKVGVKLRDMELIIFGNPKIGSLLMQCQPRVALDLPQKALVWEDDKGRVWVSYNDPRYLAARHRMKGCGKVLAKISGALAGMAKAAAGE